GPTGRSLRWVRRRPLAAALGATLVMLAIVIAAAVQFAQRAQDTHRLAQLQHQFESGLDTPELTAEYLERMDGWIATLGAREPEFGAEARRRLHGVVAAKIRG